MNEHLLIKSSRIPGRFALDTSDGFTLSNFYPVRLKLGHYWLDGTIQGSDAYYFVPEGGNFRDDRVELREGMIVQEREVKA